MRCKPGDLAFIVREDKGCEPNVGAVVRVVELDGPGSIDWRCYCEHKQLVVRTWENGKVVGLARRPKNTLVLLPDAHLWPLRNPPENAPDQTLAWLPVPQLEIAL